MLTGALLVGSAVGLMTAVASTLWVDAAIRPDVAIVLVVGIPSAIGMLTILLSGRRWVTTLGAFILAIAPGWFGALVMIQVVHGV
jgi:Putative holin